EKRKEKQEKSSKKTSASLGGMTDEEQKEIRKMRQESQQLSGMTTIMTDINDYYALTNQYSRSQNYLFMLLRNSRILSNSNRLFPMVIEFAEVKPEDRESYAR